MARFSAVRDAAEKLWRAVDADVGSDAGLSCLATLSDGTVVSNPRPGRKVEKRILRLNREDRRRKGSANRHRTVERLARAHAE